MSEALDKLLKIPSTPQKSSHSFFVVGYTQTERRESDMQGKNVTAVHVLETNINDSHCECGNADNDLPTPILQLLTMCPR